MTTSSPESAQPAGQAGAIEIVESAYDHPDVVRLVWALHDEQVGRYGFADAVEADPVEYAPPRGLFLVAYVDGVPSACGGYRTYDSATATVELKKMYAVPAL